MLTLQTKIFALTIAVSVGLGSSSDELRAMETMKCEAYASGFLSRIGSGIYFLSRESNDRKCTPMDQSRNLYILLDQKYIREKSVFDSVFRSQIKGEPPIKQGVPELSGQPTNDRETIKPDAPRPLDTLQGYSTIEPR